MRLATALQLEQLRAHVPQKLPEIRRSAGQLLKELRAEGRLPSSRFVLRRIPLNAVALPQENGVLRASANGTRHGVSLVVDVNKNGVGATLKGYTPKVIVVAGKEQFLQAQKSGEGYALAWVGELAAATLGIQADHDFGAEELRKKLQQAMTIPLAPTGLSPVAEQSTGAWIREVYPMENYFIFDRGDKTYKQRYKAKVKGRAVVLVGEPVEVRMAYVDAANQKRGERKKN